MRFLLALFRPGFCLFLSRQRGLPSLDGYFYSCLSAISSPFSCSMVMTFYWCCHPKNASPQSSNDEHPITTAVQISIPTYCAISIVWLYLLIVYANLCYLCSHSILSAETNPKEHRHTQPIPPNDGMHDKTTYKCYETNIMCSMLTC